MSPHGPRLLDSGSSCGVFDLLWSGTQGWEVGLPFSEDKRGHNVGRDL